MRSFLALTVLITLTFSQPTRPIECPCPTTQEPGSCVAGEPFDWGDEFCGRWRQGPPELRDNRVGRCYCTKEEVSSSTDIPEEVCVRGTEDTEYGKNFLCMESATCSDSSECNINEYCVQACCPDNKPRCSPCCKQPWNLPCTRTCTDGQACIPDGKFSFNPPVAGSECLDANGQPLWWVQSDLVGIDPENPDELLEQWHRGYCFCTEDVRTGESECIRGSVLNNGPTDEFLCLNAIPCNPGGPDTCPDNHHCVETCCDGEDDYKCAPCCDTKWVLKPLP